MNLNVTHRGSALTLTLVTCDRRDLFFCVKCDMWHMIEWGRVVGVRGQQQNITADQFRRLIFSDHFATPSPRPLEGHEQAQFIRFSIPV